MIPLAMLALPAAAVAQSAAPDGDAAQREHAQGAALFAAGRYAEAAQSFQRAFDLSAQPELLFNVGRAWERAGAYAAALDAYERYGRAVGPERAPPELATLVTEMRARVAGAHPRAPSTAEVTVTRGARSTDAPPVLPITLTVAGGLFALGAVPLWVLATNLDGDLAARCPDGVCPTALESTRDRGETLARAGDVMAGVGVATAVVGVVLWALAPSSRAVTVACASSGCAAGWRF